MIDEVSTEPEVNSEPVSNDAGTDEEVVDRRDEIFDLSDEDFEKHTKELSSNDDADIDSEPKSNESKDEPKDDDKDDVDLNVAYKAQMDEPFELDKPILIKVDGKVFDVKDSKEAKNLMEQGLKFTQKSQQLAQYKNVIGYLEDNDLLDIDTLQGVLNGDLQVNTEALKKPANQEQQQYVQQQEQVNQVAENIMSSEYADDMKMIIGSMPENAKQQISSDPRILQGLFNDAQSGFAQQIMPNVIRSMSLNNMSFLDAYMSAGKAYRNNSNNNDVKQEALKSEPKQRGRAKKHQMGRDEIFKLSDEDFEKFSSKL